MGEGIQEGTIVKWHVKVGDIVKADQVLAEVETDKAVVEIPSPSPGKLLRLNYDEGEKVKVGEILLVIGTEDEAAKPQAPKQKAAAGPAKAAAPARYPASPHHLATPATRKLARELGIDIDAVPGSGPGGRVTEDDVKRLAKAPAVQAGGGESAQAVAAPPVQVASEEGDVRVKLTHLRKVIAERMRYSKTHIPHACGMDFVDVTRLGEIREKEKKNFAPRGVKLTYLPFIVKAVAIALKEYPRFNAHFDEGSDELIIRKQRNIAIAVDTPDGLMAPVIKDIDRKSIIEIAQEIEQLADKARSRKLKLEEMRGGTFTITNVGSVGGMYSTPIINPPEVAIMGIHRIKDMPHAIDGSIKIRKIMGISMCFDHRVADGAEATLFMNVVMKHLEDPDLMLVDMI